MNDPLDLLLGLIISIVKVIFFTWLSIGLLFG
jgi:hypothetical protein